MATCSGMPSAAAERHCRHDNMRQAKSDSQGRDGVVCKLAPATSREWMFQGSPNRCPTTWSNEKKRCFFLLCFPPVFPPFPGAFRCFFAFFDCFCACAFFSGIR